MNFKNTLALALLTATVFGNVSNAQTIAGGGWHTLTVCSDSTVKAFGENASGQLGNNATVDNPNPVVAFGLTGIVSVSAGGDQIDAHSMALKNNGTVWTWGSNINGGLGNGTLTPSLVPAQVPTISCVTAISAGGWHSVALKNDSTVYTWGLNADGQLGDNTIVNKSLPTLVNGLTGVKAISAGTYHVMVLKNDGTVWTWGDNAKGQIGDGTLIDRKTPVQVTGLTGVKAISAGRFFSLVIKNDGTVWTWGENLYGQLGNNTTTNSSVPVQVIGLSNITTASAGAFHCFAIKNDATLMSWGRNTYGNLGDNTTTQRITPVAVLGLTSVAGVACGTNFSLVYKSDGTFWGCGRDASGQLGVGAFTTQRILAVQSTGSCTIMQPAQATVWTGTTNTNWATSSNWNPAIVPTSNTDVTINNTTNKPVINVAATCRNISFASGSNLTINGSFLLTVAGNVTAANTSILGTGTLKLEAYGPKAIAGNLTISNININNTTCVALGNLSVKGVLTPQAGNVGGKINILAGTDYQGQIAVGNATLPALTFNKHTGNVYGSQHYVGSCMTAASNLNVLNHFGDDINVSGTDGYAYDPVVYYSPQLYPTVWEYNEAVNNVSDAYGWVGTTGSNDALTPMKGFAVYTQNPSTIDLYGAVNNGNVSYNLSYTNSGNPSADGQNLISNPYPSAINWNTVTIPSGMGAAVYRYNPANGTYNTFAGGIGVPATVTGLIAPMQGFFVIATAPATLALSNTNRSTNAATFYNDAPAYVSLKLTTANNTDETAIAFNATSNATKIFTKSNVTELASLDAEGNKMVINNTSLASNTILPLYINNIGEGSITISNSIINTISGLENLMLVDKKLNVEHNLLQGNYTTTANAADANRFEIIINKQTASGVAQIENTLNNIKVMNNLALNSTEIMVTSSTNELTTIQITDVLGKVINTNKVFTNSRFAINNADLSSGVYFVTAIAPNGNAKTVKFVR